MTLYKIENNKLNIIKEKNNILEKNIQKIVGDNLNELMGLKFIDFEFQVSGKRIDILAFDEELNAPVLIELKRDNDKGLFDQGMEYFNILLDRDKKHVFLTTLAEKLNLRPNIKLINWENSRVIFIGKNFTQRQKRAIDFKGIPIELWDYNLYENNFFKLNEVGLEKKVNLDINSGINNTITKVKKEFKDYDLESHLEKGSDKTRELFYAIRYKILQLNLEIKENYASKYISYKINNKNLVLLRMQKNKIDIEFARTRPDDLLDPERKLKYIERSLEWYNQHISRLIFDKIEDLEYIINLIQQALKKYK